MAIDPAIGQEVGTGGVLLVRRPEPGVLWLEMNRPHVGNALDRQLGERLFAELHKAVDESVRVVVLTGKGKAFCAGDDLRTVEAHLAGSRTHSPVVGTTDDPIYLRIVEAIVNAPFPVIAALNGSAAGAGTEMACAADLRIASATARIGSCLVNVAQVGTALMLGRVVGEARATEIFLSGRLVEMDEALRIGLVTEVVEPDLLETAALAHARRLAAAPTKAIAMYKELRERLHGESIEHGLRLQNAFHVRNNREIEDSTEGAQAFLEKRSPNFTGR